MIMQRLKSSHFQDDFHNFFNDKYGVSKCVTKGYLRNILQEIDIWLLEIIRMNLDDASTDKLFEELYQEYQKIKDGIPTKETTELSTKKDRRIVDGAKLCFIATVCCIFSVLLFVILGLEFFTTSPSTATSTTTTTQLYLGNGQKYIGQITEGEIHFTKS